MRLMQTMECCFAMVHIVVALSKVEVDNVHGVDLAHLVIVVA